MQLSLVNPHSAHLSGDGSSVLSFAIDNNLGHAITLPRIKTIKQGHKCCLVKIEQHCMNLKRCPAPRVRVRLVDANPGRGRLRGRSRTQTQTRPGADGSRPRLAQQKGEPGAPGTWALRAGDCRLPPFRSGGKEDAGIRRSTCSPNSNRVSSADIRGETDDTAASQFGTKAEPTADIFEDRQSLLTTRAPRSECASRHDAISWK